MCDFTQIYFLTIKPSPPIPAPLFIFFDKNFLAGDTKSVKPIPMENIPAGLF